jgi:DNA-binding PadR family transcriptional regulator
MNGPSTTLEFALLGLVRQKPQSGYDLRKTFATTAMRHYSDSPGSIYPALKRLEARGWIEAVPRRDDEDNHPRRRQVFTLTTPGKEALVEWISRHITRDDVVFRLDELMLRFAFMDTNVPRAIPCQFLLEFEREFAPYVDELRAQLAAMSSKFPLHTGVLAFESGIEKMEAQLSWARRSRERLDQAMSSPPGAH